MGVNPKMVGKTNKPMGFPTKNDHFGVEIGGTTIFRNTQVGDKIECNQKFSEP